MSFIKKPPIERPRRDLEHMIMYSIKDEFFEPYVEIKSKFKIDRGRVFRSEIEIALPSQDLRLMRKALDRMSNVLYFRGDPVLIIFAHTEAPKSLIKNIDRLAGAIKEIKSNIKCIFIATDDKKPNVKVKNLDSIFIGKNFDEIWPELKKWLEENYFKDYMKEEKPIIAEEISEEELHF